MALINKTDPVAARAKLADWLGKRIGDAAAVEVSELHAPSSSGLSNEIFMFDASWDKDGKRTTRRMVARIAPPEGGLFHDLATEHRLMGILADQTVVPVATPIGVEIDKNLLGGNFLGNCSAPHWNWRGKADVIGDWKHCGKADDRRHERDARFDATEPRRQGRVDMPIVAVAI